MNKRTLTFAEMRRRIERSQTLMLLSMAGLLLVASCNRRLVASSEKEHANPVINAQVDRDE